MRPADCGCHSRAQHRVNGLALMALSVLARTCSWLRRLGGRPGQFFWAMACRLESHAPRCGHVGTRRYRDVHFPIDPRDNLQRQLYLFGAYEAELGDLLLAELRPGDVFLDVGANIGLHSLPAARVVGPGGLVLAFEPSAETARRLRSLVDAQNLNNIDVIEKALGRAAGTVELRASSRWGERDLGTRSLYGDGPSTGQIELVSFDAWASAKGLAALDVVKIDVEGAEYEALLGMTTSLRLLRPRLLIVEASPTLLCRAGVTPMALAQLISSLGYEATGGGIESIASGRAGRYGENVVLRPA